MINAKINKEHNKVILECDAGIASDVLYAFSDIDVQIIKEDNKCVIQGDIAHINTINKALLPFKEHIKLDDSFLKWKEKYYGKSPLLIRCGVNYSKIYNSTDFKIPHKEIENVCKYFFLPAVNMKKYKEGKWDGYISLYKRWLREFPTGLLSRVTKVLEELSVPYRVDYTYDTNPPREFDWKAKDLFEPTEDQVEALEACMKAGRCVCKAATGFGKTSVVARYLTAMHGVPTLFIANKKVLLDDAYNDFLNGIEGVCEGDMAQLKDGWFGDINLRKTMSFTKEDADNALNDKKIVVATIQSLSVRLEDNRTSYGLRKWLEEKCKFVMIDESQAINDKQWQTVLDTIKAPFRVALSATPKRTDGATMLIYAQTGELAFDTTAKKQIEQGRLCEMDIQYYPFDHKLYNDNDKDLNYAEVYSQCIVQNNKRNSFIVERVLDMLEEERQVLILIQHIEHGHILKDMLLNAGLELDDINFIWGETSDKVRKESINNFRQGKFKVLIGSTIADAGMDIKSISGIVLCGAGNSEITHIQRIGRGARAFDYKKEWWYEPKFVRDNNGVKITKVVDILDINIAFFKKQANNRYHNAVEEFGADRVHIVGADASIFRYRSRHKDNLQKIKEEAELDSLNKMFASFNNTDNVSEKDIDISDASVDNFLSGFLKNK